MRYLGYPIICILCPNICRVRYNQRTDKDRTDGGIYAPNPEVSAAAKLYHPAEFKERLDH